MWLGGTDRHIRRGGRLSAFADIQLHRKLSLFSAVKQSSPVSTKIGAIHTHNCHCLNVVDNFTEAN